MHRVAPARMPTRATSSSGDHAKPDDGDERDRDKPARQPERASHQRVLASLAASAAARLGLYGAPLCGEHGEDKEAYADGEVISPPSPTRRGEGARAETIVESSRGL